MKRIDIEEATATQLCEFATNSLGILNLRPQAGKATILARMRDVFYSEEYIELDDDEPDDTIRIDPPRQGKGKKRMAIIMIPSQEKPGGSEPVFVAVNGVGIYLPRDKKITIPWKYMHALDNAKKNVYDQDPTDLRLIYPPRQVHETPFSVYHEDPPLPDEPESEGEEGQEAA